MRKFNGFFGKAVALCSKRTLCRLSGAPVLPSTARPPQDRAAQHHQGPLTLVMSKSTRPGPAVQFVTTSGQLSGMRCRSSPTNAASRLGLAPEYIRTEFATMIRALAASLGHDHPASSGTRNARSLMLHGALYKSQAAISSRRQGHSAGPEDGSTTSPEAHLVELGGSRRRTAISTTSGPKKGLKAGHRMTFNNFAEAPGLKACQSYWRPASTPRDVHSSSRRLLRSPSRVVSPQTACFGLRNKQLAERPWARSISQEGWFLRKAADHYRRG